MTSDHLTVDLEANEVRYGNYRQSDKWVSFFATLALACVEAAPDVGTVSRERIYQLRDWSHLESELVVGQTVQREIARLSKRHGLEVLGFREGEKTKAWHLRLSPTHVAFRPSLEAVRTWLDLHHEVVILPEDLVCLRELTEAAIALQHGDAPEALRRSRAFVSMASQRDPWNFGAWATFLAARSAQRADDTSLAEDLIQGWPRWRRDDAPSRAVHARLKALSAFINRSTPGREEPEIERLELEAQHSADLGALASLWNTHGLLARHDDRPREAAVYHMRAVGLLCIEGSYAELQGAIFNLALCLLVADDSDRPPDAVMTLIDLVRRICSAFHLGDDSAQAEALGADLAVRRGEFERAEEYLKGAREILARLPNKYDMACTLKAQAHLHLARHSKPRAFSAALLQRAEPLFREVGFRKAARDAHGEALANLRQVWNDHVQPDKPRTWRSNRS